MGQLEEIEIFIRVVESGGIGKAAEQLNLAKSAVSRRLADLETRLGTKLINRTTRKSSLTEAGTQYYESALKVVASVEEMNHITEQHQAALSGTLKISAPMSFGLDHLTPVLNEFVKQHPSVILDIDFADREVDMVEEGFDVAFRITELKDSTFQARKIVPINFMICASEAYLAKHGEPKTHADLKQHKLLSYDYYNMPFMDKEDNVVYLNPSSLNTPIISNNGNFLMEMAKQGHGIVVSPTFITWNAVKEGALKPILQDYHFAPLYGYALYPQNRFLSKKARVFIDFLVAQFDNNIYWDNH